MLHYREAGRAQILRGDILVAKGQAADARSAYKFALGKVDAMKNRELRDSIQMRLDALGG